MKGAPEIDDVQAIDERRAVLDAALAELASKKNVDKFTLEGVAARLGRDPLEIKQLFPNTPALFTAALIEWGERTMPIPDTGTLRGDLIEYSRSYAEAVNTPTGRLLLDMVVISPRDWDVQGSKRTFRRARPNRLKVMVQRAIDRGECSNQVDPALVVELIAAALATPILFYDEPISDEYCRRVVDVFLQGILRS